MNEVPIACTLSASEQAQRVGSWEAISSDSMLDATISARGASARFRAEAEGGLRDLIAAESRCCPFLEFDLWTEGTDLRLTVEGPEGARSIILDLLGLDPTTEVAADGPGPPGLG